MLDEELEHDRPDFLVENGLVHWSFQGGILSVEVYSFADQLFEHGSAVGVLELLAEVVQRCVFGSVGDIHVNALAFQQSEDDFVVRALHSYVQGRISGLVLDVHIRFCGLKELKESVHHCKITGSHCKIERGFSVFIQNSEELGMFLLFTDFL